MKKIIIFLGILFIWLSMPAQNQYYYYKGQRIYLQENPLVRYVELKQIVTQTEAMEFHEMLNEYCWRTDEYSPYFNKYYINQDKYAEFLQVCFTHDSIISLHTPNYARNDTSSMYPTRILLVKSQTKINLQAVLRENNIPFSNILQSKYNDSEYTIYLTNDEPLRCAAQLYETGLFVYAEPDFVGIIEPTGYEDNPKYPNQWAVHNQNTNINLLPAWAVTTGHPKIKVAVIDSGVELNHPDLVDNLLEGYDAVNDLQNPSMVCCGEYENFFDYHGTCCAGIIGAANNDIGIVGVAHTSKIVPIRYGHTVHVYSKDILPDTLIDNWCWTTQTSWIIDAFNHACYEDQAEVINCSFGIQTPSNVIDNKVSDICNNGRNGLGCVVVVSAGNTYNEFSLPQFDTLNYLSRHPSVISVGSVNPCGERVVYGNHCNVNSIYNSCYGDSLDVVAPGILIPTTTIDMGYNEYFSGTSSSAPHVSGLAALILSVNPCLTREEVKYVIESTCTKIRPDLYNYENNPNHPNGTWNIQVGYGLVNAGAAVDLAQQLNRYTYIKDTVITGNITWTGNKMIHDSLVVNSSAVLTITDTVYMSSSARLIVRPGGKLVLDGGTLTSACSGELWQGIEVVGDRTKRQLAIYQGTVELKNGAVIENAHFGIHTGYRGAASYATAGGIILADSAFFINNRCAVAFISYENTTGNGTIVDNQSHFYRCEFTVDDNNLFAQNNCQFIDHVTMWDVRGVLFNGCRFSNTTTVTGNRHHAIYTEDAGFQIGTYCRAQYSSCECPENQSVRCEFSGFTTAVEANTTNNQQIVMVDQAVFRNNDIGLEINGNNFAIVTSNDFNLQNMPGNSGNIGLYLNNCSGYQVEGNRFHRAILLHNNSTGIRVHNSGIAANSIYRNVFDTLNYGIYVSGTNGNTAGGLQMLCGDFNENNTDIYISTTRTTVSPAQGSLSVSAGNAFEGTNNYNIENTSSQSIVYYYTGKAAVGNPYYPSLRTTTNVLPYVSNSANPCASTLCEGGGTPKSLSGFQSGMNAYTSAEENVDVMDGGTVETQNLASLQTMRQTLSNTYYAAVREIMSDTVLDLNELEQWHTAAQPIGDPYSLTETRFMEGYAELFTADADDAEMANYADFHTLKLALRGVNDGTVGANNHSPLQTDGHINWYALTDGQIAQLQTIAERNTGRASAMAKGVLCFFHGICYEDEWDNAGAFDTPQQGDDTTGIRAKRTATDNPDDAALSVYPNPTDDVLFIELRGGAGIATVALYDLQGRIVGANNHSPLQGGTATINMKSIPAGVYVLRVTDADGKEYYRKIVRK